MVLSTAMNASSSVSLDTMFCSGHSAGHAASPSRSSPHATSVPVAATSSAIPHNRLRKTYTPSFDVKAVHDCHDHGIDRPVFRRGRKTGRTARRIENHFAQPRADAVHRDDIPTLAPEVGGEVLDHHQLERLERWVLSRRYDSSHDASELHWW